MELLYKALNPDLTCLGYQYEVGKLHEFEGEVEMCYSGFHACRKMEDVFDYYNADNCIVYLCEGKIEEEGYHKVVCSKIQLIRKVDIRDIKKVNYITLSVLSYIVKNFKHLHQYIVDEIIDQGCNFEILLKNYKVRPYQLEVAAKSRSMLIADELAKYAQQNPLNPHIMRLLLQRGHKRIRKRNKNLLGGGHVTI